MRAPERNRLLAALRAQEYARILADLDSVQLQARQQLTALDEPTERVYFPRDAVVSMLVLMEDGKVVDRGPASLIETVLNPSPARTTASVARRTIRCTEGIISPEGTPLGNANVAPGGELTSGGTSVSISTEATPHPAGGSTSFNGDPGGAASTAPPGPAIRCGRCW